MQTIKLGDQDIHYDLKTSDRRTVGLEVNSSGCLIVKAPSIVPLSKIEQLLKYKKAWIIKKIEFAKSHTKNRLFLQFVDGEIIPLLGRNYILRVTESDYNSITDIGSQIFVEGSNKNQIRNLVLSWLQNEFEQKMNEIFSVCLNHFNLIMKTEFYPQFKIRKMHRRWGSCSSDGRIHLSHTLLLADPNCISYVVYHELSHLIHYDHSAQFYRVLSAVCPRHKELKNKLNSEIILFEK